MAANIYKTSMPRSASAKTKLWPPDVSILISCLEILTFGEYLVERYKIAFLDPGIKPGFLEQTRRDESCEHCQYKHF